MPPTPWFDELAEFLRVPSVSADPAHAADVGTAGQWVCDFVRAAGGNAELVDWHGQPLAIGELTASGAASAPTILCYGHFDVQPPAPLDLWESPPFEAELREGYLYGRGSVDDKGTCFCSSRRCVSSLLRELPVNVRFAFDGEERSAATRSWSGSRRTQARRRRTHPRQGHGTTRPTGLRCCRSRDALFHLRVRTGDTDMHSGLFGAAQRDACVDGRARECRPRRDGRLPEPLRQGIAASGGAGGLGSLGMTAVPLRRSPITAGAEEFYVRTFAETSLDVNGIASGSPDLVKTVLPIEARANVSIRLAPGQDPATIQPAFEKLVREGLPEGAELEITLRTSARPGMTPVDAPALRLASDAFEHVVGTRPLLVRSGGTLPIYASLVDRATDHATGFGIERMQRARAE
jgi:acetylornithine deacetylase/succinyl-diaminopimelate desuccinylase-like protein